MMPTIIVDTNVIVAGLLTANNDSPVARILDGMLAAAFPFVVSAALLAEYGAVLDRPALCKAHGLSAAQIQTLLIAITEPAIMRAPAPSIIEAPDSGDQHLWDLLASDDGLRLVTGDKLLFQRSPHSQRVITPRACIRHWNSTGQTPDA